MSVTELDIRSSQNITFNPVSNERLVQILPQANSGSWRACYKLSASPHFEIACNSDPLRSSESFMERLSPRSTELSREPDHVVVDELDPVPQARRASHDLSSTNEDGLDDDRDLSERFRHIPDAILIGDRNEFRKYLDGISSMQERELIKSLRRRKLNAYYARKSRQNRKGSGSPVFKRHSTQSNNSPEANESTEIRIQQLEDENAKLKARLQELVAFLSQVQFPPMPSVLQPSISPFQTNMTQFIQPYPFPGMMPHIQQQQPPTTHGAPPRFFPFPVINHFPYNVASSSVAQPFSAQAKSSSIGYKKY